MKSETNIQHWFENLDLIGHRVIIKDNRLMALKTAKKLVGSIERFDKPIEWKGRYILSTQFKITY